MRGFVLAAGFGTRLAPITDTLPKPLMPVGNLPLIGFAMRLLAHHGITDVIVNLHHLAKTLREGLGDGSQFGVSISYSEEEEILGTGGGVRKVREQLEDGPFVLINSDTIIDLDLTAVIDEHRRTGALATLVLREDPQQGDYGQLEIDEAGRVRRILGHGDAEESLRPLMFAGVHVIDPRLLDYLPPDIDTCIMRYGYIKALKNDEHIHSVVATGYWNDAGTPERYLQANADALAQRMNLVHVDPLAGFAHEPKRAVAEVVRMGEGVDLGSGAEIRPPVLLGDGTKVGEGATIGPECVVRSKVQVGKEARLSQCVVLDGVRIEPGAQLQRVVVSKKAILSLDEPETTEES